MARISNKNINYMFSKSRAFFFSTAVVFILLLIFFWVSTSLGLTTLEKFAFDLTQTSLFGYKIPQLFGAGLEGNQVEQVNLLKIVFTILDPKGHKCKVSGSKLPKGKGIRISILECNVEIFP